VKGVSSSEQSSSEDSYVSFDGNKQEKVLFNENCCTNDTNGRVEEALSMSANLINIEPNEAADIDVNLASRSDDETCTSLESAENFVCSTDSPMPLFKHFESVTAKGVDAVRVFEPVVYSFIKDGRDVPAIDKCCVEDQEQDVSDFSAEHPNKVLVDVGEKALGDYAPLDCGDDFAVLHDVGFVLRRNDAATNKEDEDRPNTSRYLLQEHLAGFAWNSGLLQPFNEQDSELPHATAHDFPVGMALTDEEHVARQSIAAAIKQTCVCLGSSRNPGVPTVHANIEEGSKQELSEQGGIVQQDDSVQQPNHLKSPSVASTGSVGESLVAEEESSSAPSEDIEHDITDRLSVRYDSVRFVDDFGLPEMPEPLGRHIEAKDIASEDSIAETILDTTDNPAATSFEDEGHVDHVSIDSDHNVRPSIANPVVVIEERTVVLADSSCDHADEIALSAKLKESFAGNDDNDEIALDTALERSSAGNDDNASAKAVGESVDHIQSFDPEKLDDNTEAQAQLNYEKPALSSHQATNVSVGDDDTRVGTTNELQKDSVNAPPPRDVENLVAVAPLDEVCSETGLRSEHYDSALGTSLDSVGAAVSLYEQNESVASNESANTSSTTGGVVGHDDLEARPEAPLATSERAGDSVDKARMVPANHTPLKFGLLKMSWPDPMKAILFKEKKKKTWFL
jgi:hypothetical protein